MARMKKKSDTYVCYALICIYSGTNIDGNRLEITKLNLFMHTNKIQVYDFTFVLFVEIKDAKLRTCVDFPLHFRVHVFRVGFLRTRENPGPARLLGVYVDAFLRLKWLIIIKLMIIMFIIINYNYSRLTVPLIAKTI